MDTNASDDAVVRQVLGGQRDMFGILVRRYLPVAHAVACAYVGRASDAEDVAQEAFLKAYRALDSLRDPGKFEGWLVTITRNAALRFLSTRRRDARLETAARTAEASETPDMARKELRRIIREKVGQLDQGPREILMLHYYAGKTTAEIAGILGITRHAAKKRLERARHTLGEELLSEFGPAFEPERPDDARADTIIGAVVSASVPWTTSGELAVAEAQTMLMGGPIMKVTVGVAVVLLAGLSTWFIVANARNEGDRQTQPPENGVSSTAAINADLSSVPDDAASTGTLDAVSPQNDTPSQAEAAAGQLAAALRNTASNVPGAKQDAGVLENTESAALKKKLDAKLALDFEDSSLAQVLGLLGEHRELSGAVDWRVVAQSGQDGARSASSRQNLQAGDFVTDGMLKSLDVRDKPLGDVLGVVLSPLGLEYAVEPGFIWVSTKENMAPDRAEKVDPEKAAAILDKKVSAAFEDEHISRVLFFLAYHSDEGIVIDWRVVCPPTRRVIPGPQQVQRLPFESFAPHEEVAPASFPGLPGLPQPAEAVFPRFVPQGNHVTDGRVPHLRTTDARVRDSLTALFRPLNLDYRAYGDFIWVSSNEKLEKEPFEPKDASEVPGLQESLAAPVTLTAKDENIKTLVESLQESSGVRIVLDASVGAGPSLPVVPFVHLESIPLEAVLWATLRGLDLDYDLQADHIWVSTGDLIRIRSGG